MWKLCPGKEISDNYSQQSRRYDKIPFLDKTQMNTVFFVFVGEVFVARCFFSDPLCLMMKLCVCRNIQAENTNADMRYYYIAYRRDTHRTEKTDEQNRNKPFFRSVFLEHRAAVKRCRVDVDGDPTPE